MPSRAKVIFLILLTAGLQAGYGQTNANNAGFHEVPSSFSASVRNEWPKVILNILVESKRLPSFPDPISEFQIQEDHSPQKVQRVDGSGAPVSLCIQIDVSRSMGSHAKEIRDAALSIVKSLPSGSEVMVVFFAEKSFLALPFTPAAAVNLDVFDRIHFGNGTAVFDSITTTEPYFRRFAQYSRRAIVMVTDGRDVSSKHHTSDALRSMLMPGSPFVYVLSPLATGSAGAASFYDVLSSSRMRLVAANDEEEFLTGAAEISRFIGSQFALTYTSTSNIQDDHLHKIEIKLTQADAHVKIESLPGFYAPVP